VSLPEAPISRRDASSPPGNTFADIRSGSASQLCPTSVLPSSRLISDRFGIFEPLNKCWVRFCVVHPNRGPYFLRQDT